MTQKNDTPALVLAFLITAGLVAGGFWWLTQRSGSPLGTIFSSKSNSPTLNSGNSGNPNTNVQAFAQTFAQVENLPSGSFNYGGSTSWAPVRGKIDPMIQQARSEFRLRYVDPVGEVAGSAAGIRMLLRNELTFAQSSRPLSNQEYQQAEQQGIKLKQVPVAIDSLAVAVNPSLNISGLTLAQLQGIYSSQIQNWQEVGGPNLPIQPLTRPVATGGTIELFVEQVLHGKGFGATVQTVGTTTDALRKLSNTPGGIYFASASEVVEQCTIKPIALSRNPGDVPVPPYRGALVDPSQCPAQRNQLNMEAFQTGQYPLTRNLFVVIKQNGQIEEKAGEAYANLLLSAQGQELMAKAGLVRIH
jgi:phosphate transport system substrate-binding protein